MSNELRIVLVAVGILALFMAFIMLETYHINIQLDRQVRDRQGVIYKIEGEYTEIRVHLKGIEERLDRPKAKAVP
jgi:hypothetical protein